MADDADTWYFAGGAYGGYQQSDGWHVPQDEPDMAMQTGDGSFAPSLSYDNSLMYPEQSASEPYHSQPSFTSFEQPEHESFFESHHDRSSSQPHYDQPSSESYLNQPSQSYFGGLRFEAPFDDQLAAGSDTAPSGQDQQPLSEEFSNDQLAVGSGAQLKLETIDDNGDGDDDDDWSPGAAAAKEYDEDESYDEQPHKKRKLSEPSPAPKVNKDGRLRKMREPRKYLLRWSDDDIKLALLGIVRSCGEVGVRIPFDMAAQWVDERCTASALQQAILKMHTKMVAEGHQLPRIKMHWPKKRGRADDANSADGTADGTTDGTAKAVFRDNSKVPRKKPTLSWGTQTKMVTLKGLPPKELQRLSDAEGPQNEDEVSPAPSSTANSSAQVDAFWARQSPITPARSDRLPLACPPGPPHALKSTRRAEVLRARDARRAQTPGLPSGTQLSPIESSPRRDSGFIPRHSRNYASNTGMREDATEVNQRPETSAPVEVPSFDSPKKPFPIGENPLDCPFNLGTYSVSNVDNPFISGSFDMGFDSQ